MSELVIKESFDLQPSSFEEAIKYAEFIAKSSLVPKDYKDKPADVLIAIQMGKELGLKPLQALQNIATINGRPCIWGDAMLALVKSHSDFEYIKESIDGNTAYCIVKRKNQPEHLATFSSDDAKRAGLASKQGPWQQYPNRMLQLRARGFALRDVFPDALKGIISREEASDYPPEKIIDGENNKADSIKKLIQKDSVNSNVLNFDTVKNNFEKSETLSQLKDYGKILASEAKNFQGTENELIKLREIYEVRKDDLKELKTKTISENAKKELDASWEEFTNIQA